MYDFFTHSSVDEHLGCFHVIASVNGAAKFAAGCREVKPSAVGQPRGVGWGGRWEGGSKGRGHMCTHG